MRKIAPTLSKPPRFGTINLTDGNGLQFRITYTDKRIWSLQYLYRGSMRKYKIGCYPETSVKNARAKTTTLRAEVQADGDPQTIKKASRSPFSTNFEACF